MANKKKKRFGTKYFVFIFESNGQRFPYRVKRRKNKEKARKAKWYMFYSFLLSLDIQSCYGDLFAFALGVMGLNVIESRWQKPKRLSGIQVMVCHLERVTVYSPDTFFISPDKNCWKEQPVLGRSDWNRALFASLRAEMTARLFNMSVKEHTFYERGFTWVRISIYWRKECVLL